MLWDKFCGTEEFVTTSVGFLNIESGVAELALTNELRERRAVVSLGCFPLLKEVSFCACVVVGHVWCVSGVLDQKFEIQYVRSTGCGQCSVTIHTNSPPVSRRE